MRSPQRIHGPTRQTKWPNNPPSTIPPSPISARWRTDHPRTRLARLRIGRSLPSERSSCVGGRTPLWIKTETRSRADRPNIAKASQNIVADACNQTQSQPLGGGEFGAQRFQPENMSKALTGATRSSNTQMAARRRVRRPSRTVGELSSRTVQFRALAVQLSEHTVPANERSRISRRHEPLCHSQPHKAG